MTLQILSAIAMGIPWTLAVTIAAFLIGATLGAPLCAMRFSAFAVLRHLGAALTLLLPATPPLVWFFFIFFGLGFGYLQINPFEAAAVGLGLIAAANMAEIYRG